MKQQMFSFKGCMGEMHIQEPKKSGANKMVATRAKKFESHKNHKC
jgi:hypothetical protein